MSVFKSFRLLAALLAAATAASAIPAAYAEDQGAVELGIFGGYDAKHQSNELGNAVPLTTSEIPGAAFGGGLRIGYHILERLTAELEAKAIASKLQGSGDASPVFGVRGSLLFNLLTEGTFRPFVRAGLGADILVTDSVRVAQKVDPDGTTVLGLGTRIAVTENFGARLDLLGTITAGRGNKMVGEAEAWLGLYYTLGGTPADTDGDGVPDRADACKAVREDVDGWQDSDGCPDDDNDGDGIADSADKCPLDAETVNKIKDTDGCPDGDGDGDGIEDSDDKCPAKAETVNGFEDADGCPDDPDTDKDGIADSADKCPKQAEVKNGYQDEDGCPDSVPDSDKDGLDDLADKCPKEPESRNGYQDEDGCPDAVPEKLRKFAGAIKGIEFETGSATIAAKSFAVLDNAVLVLAEFKDTGIEVQGHTDNVGDVAKNKKLSLDRAEAVKAYLISKGIDAKRVSTVGFGPDKPVADNKSPKGRAQNRRIEFALK